VDGNDTYFSQEISILNIDVKLRASNRALKRAMNVKGFNQLLNLIALRTLSPHVNLHDILGNKGGISTQFTHSIIY